MMRLAGASLGGTVPVCGINLQVICWGNGALHQEMAIQNATGLLDGTGLIQIRYRCKGSFSRNRCGRFHEKRGDAKSTRGATYRLKSTCGGGRHRRGQHLRPCICGRDPRHKCGGWERCSLRALTAAHAEQQHKSQDHIPCDFANKSNRETPKRWIPIPCTRGHGAYRAYPTH